MCFTVAIVRHNTLLTIEKYYDYLDVQDNISTPLLPEFPDYYFVSGFEHPALPVIHEKGISLYQWGLVPAWTRNDADAHEIRSKTLNAIGETLFEKPSFRKPVLSQRCILPVSGFYDYRDFNGLKYPYYIYSTDNQGFLLGCVYDIWINPATGETNKSFSIVTTPANSLMEKIHNLKKRMPLILPPFQSKLWVNSNTDVQLVKSLIRPYDARLMEAHTISRIANNTRLNRNIPEIMNKVNYPELDGFIENTLF
jgi:putative SOS response-associated peptidase YedK